MSSSSRLFCMLLPALFAAPAEALAHAAGQGATTNPLLWTFEPGVVISLLLMLVWYTTGVVRLWCRTSFWRGMGGQEVLCYLAGWFTLVIALVSPLHPLGNVLFSAHMTQHELLMLVAAPLLVLGNPVVALLSAFPRRWNAALARSTNRTSIRSVGALVCHPFTAWLLHALILWVWHIPALFEATLTSELIHGLQHASFLGSALLFWWAIMHGRQRVLGYGMAVLYVFTTALHSGLLGALLTFARTVWYPVYDGGTEAWALTALEDQQLGGLIMWVPAGLVYIIAGLALFAGWLRESERRAEENQMKSRSSVRAHVA